MRTKFKIIDKDGVEIYDNGDLDAAEFHIFIARLGFTQIEGAQYEDTGGNTLIVHSGLQTQGLGLRAAGVS